MATRIGIGFSQKTDSLSAIEEAAQQAKKQLEQDRIDAAIIFNTIHYKPEDFLPLAYKTLKFTKFIGCSTAGIIFEDKPHNQGILVAAIYSEEIRFESSSLSHINLQDPQEAGRIMASKAITDFGEEQRKLFFLLTDSLITNHTELIKGIKERLGKDFLIAGACSSDNFQFKKTYQYHQNICMNNGIAGILLGGRLDVAMSLRHGWRPLGKPRNIDKTEANIIKKIQNQEAISLYKEYFEEEAETLSDNPFGQINIRYPLGIKIDSFDEKNKYLLRNTIKILKDGSIVCQDSVPENSEAHIMIGTKDSCLLSAENAARELKEQLGKKTPKFIFVVESLIRHKILGKNVHEEIESIRSFFGTSVPIVGMCSCGEIFSIKAKNNITHTLLHNNSIMLIALT